MTQINETSLTVQILMYDGVDELDVVGPYAVFATAAQVGAPLGVSYAALGPPGPFTARNGTVIEVKEAWRPDLAGLHVVPGGNFAAPDEPGVHAQARRPELLDQLRSLVRPDVTVAAVCTGSILLAAAGLTTARPATTHPRAIDALKSTGAVLTVGRVVDDGDLVTSGGVTSGIDLALWLVERYAGADLASTVERILDYERRGPIWQADDRR